MLRLLIALGCLLVSLPANGQENRAGAKNKGNKKPVIGFVDVNRDGLNDRFRDANGDGIDDVSGKGYDHHFEFVDRNNDRVNDLFVDADGDGVNDLNARYLDKNGDGICDNIIDADGDGLNDITGLKYSKRTLQGYRFGRIAEELRRMPARFVDEDGDGMNDLVERYFRLFEMNAERPFDRFVDEDGDGIDDCRLGPRPLSPFMQKRWDIKKPVRKRPSQRHRGGSR